MKTTRSSEMGEQLDLLTGHDIFLNELHRKYCEWKENNPTGYQLLQRFAVEAMQRTIIA